MSTNCRLPRKTCSSRTLLQSQIRPHFIINTIYSFITLNQIGETELLKRLFLPVC